MTFRDRVFLGIIGSCLTLALFAPSCDPKPVEKDAGIVLQEDEVGWNCRTMGNKVCGEDLERNR